MMKIDVSDCSTEFVSYPVKDSASLCCYNRWCAFSNIFDSRECNSCHLKWGARLTNGKIFALNTL